MMNVAQRVLAGVFFLMLACTALVAFREHQARGLWRETRDLQGTPEYDATLSDQRYEAVDLWHTRRTTSMQLLACLGIGLGALSYAERRRRSR